MSQVASRPDAGRVDRRRPLQAKRRLRRCVIRFLPASVIFCTPMPDAAGVSSRAARVRAIGLPSPPSTLSGRIQPSNPGHESTPGILVNEVMLEKRRSRSASSSPPQAATSGHEQPGRCVRRRTSSGRLGPDRVDKDRSPRRSYRRREGERSGVRDGGRGSEQGRRPVRPRRHVRVRISAVRRMRSTPPSQQGMATPSSAGPSPLRGGSDQSGTDADPSAKSRCEARRSAPDAGRRTFSTTSSSLAALAHYVAPWRRHPSPAFAQMAGGPTH